MKVLNNKVPVKIWTGEIEESALKQLNNLSELPFIYKHIACMPDVHAGYGSTVGSVIATREAIIPSTVGVDIGCGMLAQKLTINAGDLPDSLFALRSSIEAAVPHGRTDNGGRNDKGSWNRIPRDVETRWSTLKSDRRLQSVKEKYPGLYKGHVNDARHLGSLGTGNHFIEVCLDQNQDVWVMLHSGSRGIGNRIGSFFTELAKQDMQKFFISLPDKDLAYFVEGSEHFDNYIDAMTWAQDYAIANREIMMQRVLDAVSSHIKKPYAIIEKAVNCHHNYAARENHFGRNVWITRKGAVRARKGDLGIIPGSMGQRSYIVEGLGNPESFMSCSHGAGRAMSRTKAKCTFSVDDLIKQTEGVECRKDKHVMDEIPGAYKNIDQVMENQKDLVKPLFTLKQVVCVKG